MFVVDTNILVYAANEESPFYKECRSLLSGRREQDSAWYLSWGIAYEFRVSTHPRVFRTPWKAAEAWAFLDALLPSPGLGMLTPTERHGPVVREIIREIPHLTGNLMHDAQTAALMREHGIRRIYTRNTDFHRFPFLEPIDPLSESAS